VSNESAFDSLADEGAAFLDDYRGGDEDKKALYALRLFEAVNMVTLGVSGKEYNYLVEHPDVEAIETAAMASRKCFDTTPKGAIDERGAFAAAHLMMLDLVGTLDAHPALKSTASGAAFLYGQVRGFMAPR
jgi:hypothetical protein